MPVVYKKAIKPSGLESRKEVLRLVLAVWDGTNNPVRQAKIVSYLEGLGKVFPKNSVSKDIQWLQSVAKLK